MNHVDDERAGRTVLNFIDVKTRAHGRWLGILHDLGIEVPDHPKKHAPCPGCGGVDRFRLDDLDGRGTWVCSGGGADLLAGDGFDLIRHVRGCGAREALEVVTRVLVGADISRNPPSRAHAKPPGKRVYGLELWLRAFRDDAHVAQHLYLVRKGFHHAHGGGVVGGVRSGQWEGDQACLLVPIRAHGTGKVIAVQAITGNSQKCTFGSMTADDGTPGYLALGNSRDRTCRLFVCEGWADIVSLVFLAYRGNACGAVAFGKSRMENVAEQFRRDMDRQVFIIGDRP